MTIPFTFNTRFRSIKKWMPLLLFIVACCYLCYQQANGFWEFLRINWISFRFPYPLDYGEGQLLDKVLLLSRLESIYTSHPGISGPPYAICNYPPVYPLIQVPFAWLFGPAMWYGRAISILSILASAIFIGLTVHELTRNKFAGLIGGLTLLCFPYITGFSMFVRVDSLALGFACAALYTVVRWGGTLRGVVATAALLLASIYSKQSYGFVTPMAAFVWLYHEHSPRRAFELAALVAIPGLLLFGLINVVTNGSFYFNLVSATISDFTLWNVLYYLKNMLLAIHPLLYIGAFFYCIIGIWDNHRPISWWLVAPFFIGSLVTAILIGKTGASWNYLFEHSVAFALIAGCLFDLPGKRKCISGAIAFLLGLQIQIMIFWTKDFFLVPVQYKLDHRESIARMAWLVHEAKGYVLADQYSGLIPLDNRMLYLMPWEFKNAVESHIWSEQSFLVAIAKHEFGLFLIEDVPDGGFYIRFWTTEALKSISEYYYISEKIGNTLVYRPKSTTSR